MGLIKTLFGSGNAREVTRLAPIVQKINALEEEIGQYSDEKLRNQTKKLREELKKGATLDDILAEAFATVREAAKREIGQRHFDVQLIGGIVLHQGKIAEMRTGEGKTLVATLPLYLNALEGKGAHLITVNDYLAKFQGEWMGRVYDRLQMTTGIAQNQGVSYLFDRNYQKDKEGASAAEVEYENLRPCSRKEAYGADITYGTNNEFGFDYLRDNMAQDAMQLVGRDLRFAIVDEVDSILIDEARTPLIISAPAEESADLYARFAVLAKTLKAGADYEVDEKARAVSLTDQGISNIERLLGISNVYQPQTISLVHHLEEAVKAEVLFKKNKDYIVKEGEVVIVDEFTGRLMPGRRYSEGLHQAIEAKEGVKINRESDTLATISFQNLFRLYDKLAGMTGTAATEAEEFHKIYKLDVVEIPTNRSMVRQDLHDQIYKTEIGKYQAIVSKIKDLNKKGQPVLVGTISIAKSEVISKLLKQSGIRHEVLNAKLHEKEAKIIAQAGRLGAVTVATNMAGRGVDILLGGNPQNKTEAEKVIKAGGLFVIGTERHESRRIDNQLRGRSGRQGDPGSSQFYISTDDDLMRIFGGDRLKNLMNRLGLPDDQPIEHSLISRSIESAQRKVEGHNFDIRKQLVEYDDVMNKQREVLYRKRKKILLSKFPQDDFLHEEILSKFVEQEKAEYLKRTKNLAKEIVMEIEKKVYLSVIDQLWVEHLNTMDQLRDSIGLRGYGQIDPLIAYKEESFMLFERLMKTIDDEAANVLMRVDFGSIQITPAKPPENKLEYRGADIKQGTEEIIEAENALETRVVAEPPSQVVAREQKSSQNNGVITTVRSVQEKMNQAAQMSQVTAESRQKVGRNDPCPCGATKPDGRRVKYKHCHGK